MIRIEAGLVGSAAYGASASVGTVGGCLKSLEMAVTQCATPLRGDIHWSGIQQKSLGTHVALWLGGYSAQGGRSQADYTRVGANVRL
eukprot:247058-Pleurochrysis_carterae.AAC.1